MLGKEFQKFCQVLRSLTDFDISSYNQRNEYWAISNIICDEQEKSIPPEIFIPKSRNNTEQSEMCGRVIDIQAEEKRTEEEVQSKKKAHGFFIAQGRLKNRKVPGVFVTLKKDHETLISLSSVLDPGDVITELSSATVSLENTTETTNKLLKTKNICLTIMCISDRKHN
ncbi:uncharacterized protein LOC143235642 [Tachypleus tridentatus]|uniref:uncharacterized protein LOC143235642 n=1 Tax=Tachypleus tridentatus TaxID=6853 RepID=UPI003FD574C9